MTSAAKALPAVLAHIDADLDNSLNRLFELVRIPSISTDSAFKESCKAAADFVAKDLESLGFEAAVRPTAGHPVVTATSNGATAPNNGPRVLFYGHYDVQPVDPLDLWSTPPFEPQIEQPARRPQDHPRARRLRRQGPVHDLRRGLPRLQGGDRQAAARHHDDDRGRGGVRLEEPVRLRAHQRRRVQARPRARLRHRDVGHEDAAGHHVAARSALRGGDDHLRRPRPAFGPVRRRRRQSDPRSRAHHRRACTTRTAASRCRAFTTACRNCRPTSRPS